MDLKSHLSSPANDGNLAFRQPTIDRISDIFCEQLQAAPEGASENIHSPTARKLDGWRMNLWQAALSYLVLKNSPLGRTDGLTDYNPHLAIFVAVNCYDLTGDDLDVDALAKLTDSIGSLQTHSFNLADYASWLKTHLEIP
jgi:hypothetical protein